MTSDDPRGDEVEEAWRLLSRESDVPIASELLPLRLELEASPEAPPELVSATSRRARAELAASHPGALAGALARLAAAIALPLFFAVLANLAIWSWGPELLSPWLPDALARGLPAAYVFGAAGWLALVCAALPSLAHHQLVRRHQEAAS